MAQERNDTTLPRTVKLFRNGRNQAVRIPRELELPGGEAIIRRGASVYEHHRRVRASFRCEQVRITPFGRMRNQSVGRD